MEKMLGYAQQMAPPGVQVVLALPGPDASTPHLWPELAAEAAAVARGAWEQSHRTGGPLRLNGAAELKAAGLGGAGLRTLWAEPWKSGGQVAGMVLWLASKPGLLQESHQTALQVTAELCGQLGPAHPDQATLQLYQQLSETLAHLDWAGPLTEVPRLLAGIFQADACVVTLWDKQQQQARRLTAWGVDLERFLQPSPRPDDAPSLTRQLVRDPRPVFLPRADQVRPSPSYLIDEFGVKSLVGMPLLNQGQALGAVFFLRIQNPQAFEQAQIKLLGPALDQLAVALENHRLQDELVQRLQETNALLEIAAIAAASPDLSTMLKEVLELCRHMLGVEAGAILLHDEATKTLYYASGSGGFGFGEGARHFRFYSDQTPVMSDVFQTGQPEFINDFSQQGPELNTLAAGLEMQNLLIAPIRVHDYPLGVFVVGNKPGGFNFNDAGLLLAMSSHVAAAVRNADLLQNTRLRLGETEILQRIAAITSASIEMDDMLAVALRETAIMFQADGAQILTPTANAHFLLPHRPSKLGISHDWPEQALALDSEAEALDLQCRVFQQNLPVLGQYTLPQSENAFCHVMSVPLNSQQGVVGVLSLFRNEQPFLPGNAELAIAIARQIAVGMQNNLLLAKERQRADLMLLINRIAQDLSATLDLRSLMRKVVLNVHDTLGYDLVFIFLAEDNNQRLICQASATTDPRHNLEAGYIVSIEDGIAGRAFRNRQSYLVPKVSEDPDYVLWPNHEAVSSGLAVPLRHGNNIYGVLELLGLEENAFSETDLLAMESLAAQVSIAIDNARLYNQAQRRLLEQGIVHQIGQDLTSILSYNELVQAVARHMTRALDTSACMVFLYDSLRDRLRLEAAYYLPGTENTASALKIGGSYHVNHQVSLARSIQSRRPLAAYAHGSEATTPTEEISRQLRENGDLSELLIPMTASNRVIGVVRWSENRRPRQFSREDERLAQVLIAQASIAIENARLFRESERRAHEQYMLNQVTVALAAATHLEELVESFAIQTHNTLESASTLVVLLDGEGQWAWHKVISASRPLEQSLLWQLLDQKQKGKSILKALREGRSVYNSLGSITQTAAQIELAMLSEEHSIALVPISYRGNLIGLIEALAQAPHSFDSEAVDLLEALANQAAVAIDNVRLSEREQRRLRQMEQLQASGRLIASELVVENLVAIVVREAAAIFEISCAAALLPDDLEVYYEVKAAHELSPAFIEGFQLNIQLRKADIEAMSDAERRQPVYISAIDDDPHMLPAHRALYRAEGVQSVLMVPLVKGTKMAGVLLLMSRDGKQRFSDEDMDLAQLYASQIAVALDNASLFLAVEERARELAEANRLKSQFLANISHELRTPMNSILGFSETILSGLYGDLNEKQSSRLERINHNGKSLLALIDDLLDISKIDAGRMELAISPVNLIAELSAVMQAIESQVQKKGIRLELLPPPSHFPLVLADPLRLRQVITNLVSNAVKFTKAGGVTLSLQVKEEVVLAPKEDESPSRQVVWVSVADSGIGISLEDQLIIFDEFRQADGSTTREFGGTGLGLAICKRLIELMGGRIWVDSEINKGSTFTFVIPAALMTTPEGSSA
jgi:GAF domain-containing protein